MADNSGVGFLIIGAIVVGAIYLYNEPSEKPSNDTSQISQINQTAPQDNGYQVSFTGSSDACWRYRNALRKMDNASYRIRNATDDIDLRYATKDYNDATKEARDALSAAGGNCT